MGKNEFVKHVKVWMVLNDVSQSELAALAGMDPSSLSRTLGDDSIPTIPTLGALAKAMGVPLMELVSKLVGNEAPPPSSKREHLIEHVSLLSEEQAGALLDMILKLAGRGAAQS